MNDKMKLKVMALAEKIEKEQIERLYKTGLACEGNIYNSKVKVKLGNKYIKVDVGSSGKYMIDTEGNIYGIKAYGVIHRGHYYGTLDTIDQYYWGEYRAFKLGGRG